MTEMDGKTMHCQSSLKDIGMAEPISARGAKGAGGTGCVTT